MLSKEHFKGTDKKSTANYLHVPTWVFLESALKACCDGKVLISYTVAVTMTIRATVPVTVTVTVLLSGGYRYISMPSS